MPIPITCPGCGWSENGPDALMGKRLKCKRCKQAFVVGGGPAKPAAKAPPPAAKPAAVRNAPGDGDLDFGEPEVRGGGRRPREQGGGIGGVLVLLIVGLLLGGGGVAGYLWYTKPAAASDDSKPGDTKKDETGTKKDEVKFAWLTKGNDKVVGDPKIDPKTDPKIDPKIDPKDDPTADLKIDTKTNPKMRPEVPNGNATFENWKKIKPMMPEEEALAILGPPHIAAPDVFNKNIMVRTWFIYGRKAVATFQGGKTLGVGGGDMPQYQEDQKPDPEKVKAALVGLKDPDDNKRNEAIGILNNTWPIPEMQAEVARGLEEAAKKGPSNQRNWAAIALRQWGTKENVPYLVELATPKVKDEDIGNPEHRLSEYACNALAALKAPDGVGPTLELTKGFFRGPQAKLALIAYGPDVAEAQLLKRYHDPLVRFNIDEVFKAYKTPPVLLVRQAAIDLGGPGDRNVKRQVFGTIRQQQTVDPDVRPAVAAALVRAALAKDESSKEALFLLQKWGVARDAEALMSLLAEGVDKGLQTEAKKTIEKLQK